MVILECFITFMMIVELTDDLKGYFAKIIGILIHVAVVLDLDV